MRIDCCRNCGVTLKVLEYCKVCKQPLKLQCAKCYHFADDPIHSNCDVIMKSIKYTSKISISV